MKLCLPLSVYYALFVQQDSTWTFQSTLLNTNIYGINFEPDQLKSIGPILLLIYIPIWSKIIVPLLKMCNIEVKPFFTIVLGGISAMLAFVCAAVLQWQILLNEPQSISAIYQLPQFIFIMLGEIFLSIPALQFVYTEAPDYMKSLFTAFWFINNAIGNLIVVIVTEALYIENDLWEYLIFISLMFFANILFAFMASSYKRVRSNKNSNMEYEDLENMNSSY